eukprot:3866172-Amphidinium_carterae.1
MGLLTEFQAYSQQCIISGICVTGNVLLDNMICVSRHYPVPQIQVVASSSMEPLSQPHPAEHKANTLKH